MEIKTDTKNQLFKRQEVVFVVESEKNPTFDEVKKQIAEQFKTSEANIDILKLCGSFGSNKFVVEAHIYDKPEDAKKAIEAKMSKKQKGELKKKAEEAEKAAEETASSDSDESETSKNVEQSPDKEKPIEEKKEEAPVE